MTKKQWLSVADRFNAQFRNETNPYARRVMALAARNLAFEFAKINGAFQYHLFYEGCGLTLDGHVPEDDLAATRQALGR